MDVLALVARCFLAAVFVVAGVGKLFDLAGARTAVEEFGVPARHAAWIGTLLPAGELAVAAALLIRPLAVCGAVGVLLLLSAFTVGVFVAMSRGRAPACHCFGQIHSEPAGRSTVIRNAVLAVPAVLVIAVGPGLSLDAMYALTGTRLALALTAIFAFACLVAVAQLASDRRRLRQQLDSAIAAQGPPGLPAGTKAPEFTLRSVTGGWISLGELLVGNRPIVLVFVSTHCEPCLDLLSTLAGWQRSLEESLQLLAVFAGEYDEVEQLHRQEGLSLAVVQAEEEAFNGYALRATPSAVLITTDGEIGDLPAQGAAGIEALVRSALSKESPAIFKVYAP